MKQELDEFNDGDASWSIGPMSEEIRYHVVFLFKIFIGPNKTFIVITKTAEEYMDTSHEFLHTIQLE